MTYTNSRITPAGARNENWTYLGILEMKGVLLKGGVWGLGQKNAIRCQMTSIDHVT